MRTAKKGEGVGWGRSRSLARRGGAAVNARVLNGSKDLQASRGNGNARPLSEVPSPAPQYPISTQGSQRVQGPRPLLRYEYGRLLIIRARINAYGRGRAGYCCRAAVPARPPVLIARPSLALTNLSSTRLAGT